MKVRKTFASLLLLVLCCGAFLAGCKQLTPAEGFVVMNDAMNESLCGTNRDIYYAKLTTVKYLEDGTKHSQITTVNVLADEENYKIKKDAKGGYVNLRAEVSISEALGIKEVEKIRGIKYGVKADGNKALKIEETATKNTAGVQEIPMTDDALFASEYFAPYSMESLLWDTKNMLSDFNNLDFTHGKVEKKGKVTTVTFALADRYIKSYVAEFGKVSPFESDYITIEISYGRIQSVIAYKREPGFENFPDAIAIDYETYKLEISYRGPKIDINI